MTGFEPRISVSGSDRSTNCVATTATATADIAKFAAKCRSFYRRGDKNLLPVSFLNSMHVNQSLVVVGYQNRFFS